MESACKNGENDENVSLKKRQNTLNGAFDDHTESATRPKARKYFAERIQISALDEPHLYINYKSFNILHRIQCVDGWRLDGSAGGRGAVAVVVGGAKVMRGYPRLNMCDCSFLNDNHPVLLECATVLEQWSYDNSPTPS